jgi:hypothetical protein
MKSTVLKRHIVFAFLALSMLGMNNNAQAALKHHWKLNESSGTTANDSIGVLDATLYGDAQFVSDATRGQVLELDGDGDYVRHWKVAFTNDIDHTVALWVKHSEVGDQTQLWISWGGSAGSYFIGSASGTGKVQFRIGSSGNQYFTADSSAPLADTWQHWAFVREGTATRLYLNGNLIQTMTVANGGVISDAAGVSLGRYLSGGSYVNGRMSDVAIWDEPLEPWQIRNAMESGAADYNATPALDHHWKLDENSGTTANDSAGLLDATLYGDAQFVSDATRGQVLELDGDGDYVRHWKVAFTNDIDHTIALWARHVEIGSQTQYWLSWGSSTARYFIGSNNGTGRIIFRIGGMSTQYFTEDNTMPIAGIWQHWAFVREGTAARLYLNGKLIETLTVANGGAIAADVAGVSIGRDLGGGNYVYGKVSDVAIWHGALNEDQIKSAMKYGATDYLCPIPLGAVILIR